MDDTNKHSSLVELVFDKKPLESADFEIAFTATLVTIVLATLSGVNISASILKPISILLIFITLFRRMAVSGRFTNQTQLLSITMPVIEFLTVLVVFHLFYTPSKLLTSQIAIIDDPFLLVTILIPEAVLLMVVLQEMIFKNYMIWWGGFALGQAGNSDNVIVKLAGGLIAFFAFRTTLVNELPEELTEAKEFVGRINKSLNEELDEFDVQITTETVIRTWKAWVFLFSLLILGTLFLLLALVLSLVLGSLYRLFLLSFSILFVRHIVRFYYLAYGLPHEGHVYYDRVGYSLGTFIINVIVVYFLFG